MNLPKALVLTVAATTFCLMTSPAFAVEETTPQNMTCQEFMDMNPKSMTPVAFWVVNRNTDFSGGDYVDWHEVESRKTYWPTCRQSGSPSPAPAAAPGWQTRRRSRCSPTAGSWSIPPYR